MVQETGFYIANLRDGGEVRLLFPEEITTENNANWEMPDVAGGTKPLSYANNEPQKLTINDLCIDHTRTNTSVEPNIETLESWMLPNARNSSARYGAPPRLLVAAASWRRQCVLTGLSTKRSFFTDDVCVRAYLSLTFNVLPLGERSRIV